MTEKQDYKRFKPSEIAESFPATADTLLVDTYLTNEPAASARVASLPSVTSAFPQGLRRVPLRSIWTR
jgi:hypothetical protein